MPKNKPEFEEAMKELEKIVEKLEDGDMSLEESVELFQKGVELSKICSKKLDEIEKKISVIIQDSDGNIREEDYEIENDI